jgi:hypothetical protein
MQSKLILVKADDEFTPDLDDKKNIGFFILLNDLKPMNLQTWRIRFLSKVKTFPLCGESILENLR